VTRIIEDSMNTHKDLDVWKRGIELVSLIYRFTQNFPKEELYGLTSQIRRSAVSIPSNIAEGSARFSRKELTHFLYISLGSLSELETQMIIAQNIGYIKDNEMKIFEEKAIILIKMLSAFIKKLKNDNGSDK
jgi:four helix bundle protein